MLKIKKPVQHSQHFRNSMWVLELTNL